MTDATVLDTKIEEFLQRLTDRFNELDKKKYLPIHYPVGLFTRKELLTIYWGFIYSGKASLRELLKDGVPLRISKEESSLPHTLNLIFDPLTQDICLIVETKRKKISGKDLLMPISAGTFKSTKPAWRIDGPIPEKYANSVYYFDQNVEVVHARKEVAISKKLQLSKTDVYIHLMTEGAVIHRRGIRHYKNSKNQILEQPYNIKISLYSKWANEGDLATWFLQNPIRNPKHVDNFTTQLLIAVERMHDKGWVHQDIKPQNILIFSRYGTRGRLALADFGCVDKIRFPKSRPIASAGYESPEIAAANYYWHHHKDFSHTYAYFYSEPADSYGRGIFKEYKAYYLDKITNEPKEYGLSHPENDMWAVGMVLFELFSGQFLSGNKPIEFLTENKLLRGLLNPDRNKRLTATQALSLHYKIMGEKNPEMIQKELELGPFEGLNLLEYALVHKEEEMAKALLQQDPNAVNHVVNKKGPYQEDNALTLAFTHINNPDLIKDLLSASQKAEHYKESLELGQYYCRINKIKNPEVKALIFSAVRRKVENEPNNKPCETTTAFKKLTLE